MDEQIDKVFSHSGDLGDIIYFLPVMRELGGGELMITKLRQMPIRTRQNLLEDGKWGVLKRLLESQDYVSKVYPVDSAKRKADYNADLFRPLFLRAMQERYQESRGVNLVTWQCIPHKIDPVCQEKQWLQVEPNNVAKYVFNRTNRYINPSFPWKEVYEELGKDAVFLGTEEEYTEFTRAIGPLPFMETVDLIEAAQIIRGSECFIGNQSCLYAIAEGMKHDALLEVWLTNPNCLFKRDNVAHGSNYQTTMAAVERIKSGSIRP